MHLRPDWTILGVKTGLPDEQMRYMVLASDTLSRAEVEASVDEFLIGGYGERLLHDRYIPRRHEYEIRATARSIVIVYGPDYQTCLRRLLTDWTPGKDDLPGLPAPVAQLEPGPIAQLEPGT
jgi:hypothetical protein